MKKYSQADPTCVGHLVGDGGCTVAPASTRSDGVGAAGGGAAIAVAAWAGRATTEQTAGNSEVPAPRRDGLGCRSSGAVGITVQTRRRALCRRPPAVGPPSGTAPNRRGGGNGGESGSGAAGGKSGGSQRSSQRRRVLVLAVVGLDRRPPRRLRRRSRKFSTACSPFSEKSRTPSVATVFHIDLGGVVETDLELFCKSWITFILLENGSRCPHRHDAYLRSCGLLSPATLSGAAGRGGTMGLYSHPLKKPALRVTVLRKCSKSANAWS